RKRGGSQSPRRSSSDPTTSSARARTAGLDPRAEHTSRVEVCRAAVTTCLVVVRPTGDPTAQALSGSAAVRHALPARRVSYSGTFPLGTEWCHGREKECPFAAEGLQCHQLRPVPPLFRRGTHVPPARFPA